METEFHRLRGKGWQIKEIAELWGVSRVTLYRDALRWKASNPLDTESQRFVDCSLIGDGCLVPHQDKTRFTVEGTNKEYIAWVKAELCRLGFKCTNSSPIMRSGSWVYYAKTRSSSLLNAERLRWYPDGNKIIPTDFKWGLDTLTRLIAEDGTQGWDGPLIYWGAKSDETFEQLKQFLTKMRISFLEGTPHKTGGKNLHLRARIQPLPGMQHKSLERKLCG